MLTGSRNESDRKESGEVEGDRSPPPYSDRAVAELQRDAQPSHYATPSYTPGGCLGQPFLCFPGELDRVPGAIENLRLGRQDTRSCLDGAFEKAEKNWTQGPER
jgi:hypothetical protein